MLKLCLVQTGYAAKINFRIRFLIICSFFFPLKHYKRNGLLKILSRCAADCNLIYQKAKMMFYSLASCLRRFPEMRTAWSSCYNRWSLQFVICHSSLVFKYLHYKWHSSAHIFFHLLKIYGVLLKDVNTSRDSLMYHDCEDGWWKEFR